jgi:uncharacterized membrane protein YfcA
MPVDILLTVILTTLIQSVFGVGVLLFGTPVLLLLGHDFVDALLVLLPISIAINSLQLLKHYRYVDIGFYKNVLIYSIPFVVLFLWIITSVKINISALVGGLLILVALKAISPAVDKALRPLFNYERTYLAIMGVIHGMTNLGGSLNRDRLRQAVSEGSNTRDRGKLLRNLCPVSIGYVVFYQPRV